MSVGSVQQSNSAVVGAIRFAAAQTGADFDYLLRTATRESSLRTEAVSRTSSAAGAFQFIEQTWLSTLNSHGAEHGYGDFAEAIERGANGRYEVPDAAMREEILALRHDARASALMAGELTTETNSALERALGRPLHGNEPYIAHFMGLGGATRFIQAAEANPDAIAAEEFSAAANANRPIFYHGDGSAKTMGEVYEHLTALPDVSAQLTGGGSSPRTEPAMPPSEATEATEVIDAPPMASVPVLAPLAPQTPQLRLSPLPPSSPGSYTMLLTPQVMDVLAMLDPAGAIERASDEDA